MDESGYDYKVLGDGAFTGAGYSVLPLKVQAASPTELIERTNALLDELQAVVDGFEGAEVVEGLAECRSVAICAVQMYEGQIARAVAEAARNQ